LLGLFTPDGARQDFSAAGNKMSDQFLKALAVAKNANDAAPESEGTPAKSRSLSKGKL
jgi:hypothetical protein